MLAELLRLIREHGDKISHAELCEQLEIAPNTLQSMIDILVRKGKIKPDDSPACGGSKTCTQKICPGPDECELVLIKPVKTIRIDYE